MKIRIPCSALEVEVGDYFQLGAGVRVRLEGVTLDERYPIEAYEWSLTHEIEMILGSREAAEKATALFAHRVEGFYHSTRRAAEAHALRCDASPAMLRAIERAVDVMVCDCGGHEDEQCERCEMIAAMNDAVGAKRDSDALAEQQPQQPQEGEE